MIHNAVTRKVVPKPGVAIGLIGHNMALARGVFEDDWDHLLFGDVLDVKASRPPMALNKGQHRVLMTEPTLDLSALFPADESFVDFDNATAAAYGPQCTVP